MTVRPRLTFSVFVGISIYFLISYPLRIETRGLIAWNIATLVYLSLFFHLAENADVEKIKVQANLQDDGAIVILVLSGLAASMCFVAIAFQLANIKGMAGSDRIFHLMLVGATIPLSWAFIHSMFALHYAHEFYDADDSKGSGIDFPGKQLPTYWDFIYFSYIIGTSGQTADVAIQCASIRKTATVHCVFAFFFNITMLGLTINVASSLL